MTKYTTLTCIQCGTLFERESRQYKYDLKNNSEYKTFCSKSCFATYVASSLSVECDNCGKSFKKRLSEIKKSNHNFCSTNCAGIFNNKARHNLEKTKEIHCKYCNEIFFVSQPSPKKVCDNCFVRRKKEGKLKALLNKRSGFCKLCKEPITIGYSEYHKECLKIRRKELGQINGKKSAASQQRRSKNEIHFADLCIKEYPDANVTINEQFFESKYGKWDADVIIHKYKIAILWNGVWHYKQIKKDCSLLQIQTRDKIKLDVINKSGYTTYIIKDEGKYNPKFVEAEFEKLKKIILIDRVA